MTLADAIRGEFSQAATEEERQKLYEKFKQQGVTKGYIDRVLKRKSRAKNETGEFRPNRVPAAPRAKDTGGFVRMMPEEVVPPEQALREFRLQDGDYRHGFIDGIGMMLLTARYNQILAASQAEIIKGQLDIYERAKGSVAEVAREAAREAAEEAAGSVVSWLSREKPWVTSSPDPFKAMMVDAMRPVLDNIVKMFTPKIGEPGGTGGSTPPGFTEEG